MYVLEFVTLADSERESVAAAESVATFAAASVLAPAPVSASVFVFTSLS